MKNSPPRWAAGLVARVCAAAGVEEPRVEWLPNAETPVRLRATRASYRILGRTLDPNRELSAGTADFNAKKICLYRGSLRVSQRLVLLHELAHWITREYHTNRFWDVAWALYQRYAPRSLAFALESEARYRTGALHAAVRAGVVTAQEATRRGLQKEVRTGG